MHPDAPAAQFEYTQVDLDRALAELAAMPTPPGVEPELFAELKGSLAQSLTYFYQDADQAHRKNCSGLSAEEQTQPWCADAQVTAAGLIMLNWRGRHMGDYDLNGEVNISDLAALGSLFGRLVEYDGDGLPVVNGDNEWGGQIDGDHNTEINSADIVPIAVNFNSRILGYRVYYGVQDSLGEIVWEDSFIPNPQDETAPSSVPSNGSTSAGNVLRYSLNFTRPVPEAGYLGIVELKPYTGSEELDGPRLLLHAGPHAMFGCSVCHTLTDYSFLGMPDSCMLCHNTPPEDKTAAWASAPGMHGYCIGCHSQHGFALSPPESVCTNCHSQIASAADAAGMGACLGCHDQAHLPDASPTSAACATCHAENAATLADEQMQDCLLCHSTHAFTQTYTSTQCQSCHANPDGNTSLDWGDAPGQHGTCDSCHATHDFKIAEPNSVCVNCHEDQTNDSHSGGNLDCLGCHNSPHLPQLPTGSSACIMCHPIPPGQEDKEWTDAPTLHAECLMCHPGAHPDKPSPAESICTNCHATLMEMHAPTGATCVSCHNYYHVPDVTHGDAGCMICHPAPPEKPAGTWAEAPGQHAQCSQCHPGTHPDVPDPPESDCLTCHTADFPGTIHQESQTACLTCHTYPHLPALEYNFTDEDCQACHTDPYYADHSDTCLDCHRTPTHPRNDGWNYCTECHPY